MAIYKKAEAAPRERGSKGGSTFQRSANGFVIRHHTVPVQKRSSKQSFVKKLFESVAGRWRDLSLADQITFDNESLNYPRVDSLGNNYFINGQQLQQSSNVNLITSIQNPIDSIPAAGAFTTVNSMALFISKLINAAFATLDPSIVQAGYDYLFYTSLSQSPGESELPQNNLFLFAIQPDGFDTLNDVWPQLQAIVKLENSDIGRSITIAVVCVERATGQVRQRLSGITSIV